jgi:hypothetical protein
MKLLLILSSGLETLHTLQVESAPIASAEGVAITLIVVFLLLVGAGIGARWMYGDKP